MTLKVSAANSNRAPLITKPGLLGRLRSGWTMRAAVGFEKLSLSVKMKFSVVLLVAGTIALASAFATDAKITNRQQFGELATVANIFEVQSSELALKYAVDATTREFAKHMIADHSRAGEDIKAAGEADKVAIPTQLDDHHQAKVDALAVAKGSDFDKAYLSQQLQAHQTSLALFSVYCTSGEEGELKKFAARALPALTQHLAEVRKLN